MTFEQLQEVNKALVTTDIKGKDYVQVNERIKAFRALYPEGCIITEMLSNEGGVCVFKASVYESIYDINDYSEEVISPHRPLATGHAYEKESSSFINKTSYIENCETSAVGRALGFLGIGIDTSIASAEEVGNAIEQQAQVYMNKDEVEKMMKFIVDKGRTVRDVCQEYGVGKLTDFTKEEAKEVMRKINQEVTVKIEQGND